MSRVMTWLKRLSSESPLKVSALVFAISLIVVVSLSIRYYGPEFYPNILVEAHGMLFDLLVISIFILWLNSLGERERTIRRYREEINDYIGWEESEATFRIVGNIKRLNRLGVSNIYLEGAYLKDAKLMNADLREAKLWHANLKLADLRDADLRDADLMNAKLMFADLMNADLRGAKLTNAYLRGANLFEANLRGIVYNKNTIWPDHFDPSNKGLILKE